MDPVVTIAIIIGIGVGAAVVATLIGYLRVILGISSMMNLNTKCMAIGWKYLYRDNMEILYECRDISEVASQITTSGYKISAENANSAEKELEKELVRIMNEVRMSAPESLKYILEAYMLKYDAMIIKRVVNAKLNKMPKSRIYEEVYPVNTITKTILEHMIEAESIEDTIRCLDATPFKECIEVWENTKDSIKFELAIDKKFFEKLNDAAKMSDDTVRDAVKRFVGVLIDVHNLKVLFRCKFMGIKDVEEYIVEGGRELAPWRLKQMSESENVDGIISQIEGTSYFKFLQDAPVDIVEIEKRIDKALLKILEEIYGTFANSPGPTLRFLVAKEYEANNIKSVIRGIKNNVSREIYERVILT